MHAMKLYFNRTSPYARKARVVVAEKRLQDAVEMIEVDPWRDPAALLQASPLSKVPVLQIEGGASLTESDTICRYLDEIAPVPPMLPAAGGDGNARAEVAGRMALAQGAIDAAFAAVMEERRPADRQWPEWVSRQQRALQGALGVFAKAARPEGRFDLGDVGLACLLGYLDFRLPHVAWRRQYPDMAAWQDRVSQRPSLAATVPA